MEEGKMDKGMAKSRGNTNESSFGISPVESQGKLTQAAHSGVLTTEDLKRAFDKLKSMPVSIEPKPHLMTDNVVDYYLSQGIIPDHVIVSPTSAKKIAEARKNR